MDSWDLRNMSCSLTNPFLDILSEKDIIVSANEGSLRIWLHKRTMSVGSARYRSDEDAAMPGNNLSEPS